MQHNKSLQNAGFSLSQEEPFDIEGFELPGPTNDTLHYLKYHLLDCPNNLNLNNELYADIAEYHKNGAKCTGHRITSFTLCPPLPESDTTVLGILPSRPGASTVIKLDENGMSVPASQSQEPPVAPAFTMPVGCLYRRIVG